MSLAFQLPYGNEDFRLLGDTNRVYSLPVDIIAELHTGIFFSYTGTVLNPAPSAINELLEDLSSRTLGC